jgi:hypothetical protein
MSRPLNLHKIFILKKNAFVNLAYNRDMEKKFLSYVFYLYKIKVDYMDISCSMHKTDKKVNNTEF